MKEGYDGLNDPDISVYEILVTMPAVDWFASGGQDEIVLEFGLPLQEDFLYGGTESVLQLLHTSDITRLTSIGTLVIHCFYLIELMLKIDQ